MDATHSLWPNPQTCELYRVWPGRVSHKARLFQKGFVDMALALKRKVGQKIRIGDDIEIFVQQAEGGQCTLGIEAPRNIPVHREEVYQRIQRGEAQKSPSS